jgi:hypothetical protein
MLSIIRSLLPHKETIFVIRHFFTGCLSGTKYALVFHVCPKNHWHSYTEQKNGGTCTSVYCPTCCVEYPPDLKSLKILEDGLK